LEIGEALAEPGIGRREIGMTAERWQQIKAIFDSAVECDPTERAELVSQRCGGDAELQREVESLLASDGTPTALFVPPLAAPPTKAVLPALAAAPVLSERYEVERELGRGGMSVVYLARDRQLLGKLVVVKVLLEETRQDPWMRQKFLQEMEALARIDHPGVVGVLDSGLTAESQRFLVMQYIEGVTLRSTIEPGGMDFARAAGLIRQIGQALAAAHEKGVWHRDLKPENIMLQCLGGEDHVKLIDFGIAGIQDSQFTGEKTKVAGSFAYMAPEQLGGRPCAASDTYALGVVAYEILTGELPDPTGESRLQLPERARRSIRKALSLRPEARQSSVREFSEELYQALAGGETARKTAVPGTVEMAHVLFTDLVGYSLLPMDRQKEYLGELQQIVRESPRFIAAEAAGDIISLPTGDGMALAFFGDPTAPAECALEIAAGLRSKPHLQLRMGIHSGPVYRVADVNANANVAGGGINLAQRVMDCGDAGHILVSKTVADVLLQLSQWAPYLSNLGECTVKHGVQVHLYNLATPELGNRKVPRKVAAIATPKARFKTFLASALVLVSLAAGGVLWLERGRRGSPAGQPSIAVLPFEDLSIEKNQEYFAKGLAEDLLDALSTVPGLQVAGKTSSFQFVGRAGNYSTIGEKLHVASILEGSVSKQGNRARIRVRLIQAKDEHYMWWATYDRDLTDIFAVQDEIARSVTGALRVKLLGGKVPGPPARSANPGAFNACLLGRHFLSQGNQAALEKAIGYFEEAIRYDSGYAPAWVGLGEGRATQAGQGYVAPEEGWRKAREAVERALVLDPNQGQAHAAMAEIKMTHDWDWDGASASYDRALALEPGNAAVMRGIGSLDRFLGRLDESIALYRRAVEVDPLSPNGHKNLGMILYYSGRQEDAAASLGKALEFAPAMNLSHCLLAQVHLGRSKPQEALAEAEKEPELAYRLLALAMVYHALGRKGESDATLAELIAKFQAVAPYQIAEVCAFRGEANRAFEWLERAYQERDGGLTEMKGDPLLNSVKGDSRYTALLKRMHLPL
jgi:TolB-like protein/class 3 adenylate cyclase/tRNA A-37 threonylcarbamoyl transferase component Bud32